MSREVNPFPLSRLDYSHRVMSEDLWPEILKRLTIKKLCQFRSVCKGWNSLISSAFFIDLHFSFACSTIPRNLKPYLHVPHRRYPYGHHELYALYRPIDDGGSEYFRQQLDCPFRALEGELKVFSFVDVIHGVVCTSYTSCSSYDVDSPAFNSTLLWNPPIHKYVTLPCLNLACRFDAIGFGYDASKNDFKVVQVHKNGMHRVCSARQGFWRPPSTSNAGLNLKNRIFGNRYDPSGCFLNGTIHWTIGSSLSDISFVRHSVLMFDCEREELTTTDIPTNQFGKYLRMEKVKLFEYVGMLAALVDTTIVFCRMDLWVMEEYGVSTSWKKLYTFQELNWELHLDDDLEWDITTYDPSFEKLLPYGPKQWIDCNDPHITKFRHILSDHIYQESLFLMNSPNAQSYTKEDFIRISTSEDPPFPNTS